MFLLAKQKWQHDTISNVMFGGYILLAAKTFGLMHVLPAEVAKLKIYSVPWSVELTSARKYSQSD